MSGPPKFPLGQVLATPGALEALPHQELQEALGRHVRGDWGDLDEGKKVRPYKTERHNLNSLLRRPVIVNKKDN